MNSIAVQSNAIDRNDGRPRSSRIAIAIAASALLLLSVLPATALAKHVIAAGDRPTIVLVHGAWAGPSAWDQVATALQNDGYRTVAPTLGLASITDDAAIVAATLDGLPGKKILVGHSYGGIVISNAAFGRSDVLGLVYTAAFVPDEGDSILSLGQGFVETDAVNHLIFDPYPFAFIDPVFFPQLFAQDLSPRKAAQLNAAQRPTSLAVLGAPSGPVAWHDLPSWYAISGQDRIIDPAEELFMARRIGATVVRFDDASHAGGFTHYASRFVKLIEQAVASTAG